MSIEATVTDINSVQEGLRPFYVEATGADGSKIYNLDESKLTGMVSKLTEFRNNNINLMKENEGLKSKVNSKPSENKEQNDALMSRIAGLEASLKSVTESKDALTKAISKDRLESSIIKAFTAAGGLPEAADDAVYRVTKVFSLNDALEVVGREGGADLMSKKDPTKPMQIDEFVGLMKTSAPHLFKKASGSGAAGGSSSGAGSVVSNPFTINNGRPDFFKCAQLRSENPALFAKYEAEYRNSKGK